MKTRLVRAIALASVGLAGAARAAEGESSNGAALSVPFASKDAKGTGAWDLQYEYGLTESFHAAAELGALHDLDGFGPRSFWFTPRIGAKFDAISWVPYISSGPSLSLRLDPETRIAFGADVAAGLDYRVARSLSLGAQYHFNITVDDEGQLLHRVGLRVMYHWGW